ncbi:ATP-binding protein [Caballeronia sp. LZ035]|uniref:sensor histidine kinase n=1 Tax=Caballeronia sp. LZ035 TaxID=3038568 RepID=UPI00285DF6A9|nr:ATP-binding protein [Caballeronia sp. LZ035]MDR5763419.1 ATP-binding protein [Caballeronia sp. LZ035]
MLPIEARPALLDQICRHALTEIDALHPEQAVTARFSGDLAGVWDAARIEEMLVNLLENAIDHGRQEGNITLEAIGHDNTATLSVTNEGNPISPEDRRTLFDPLKRKNRSPTPRRAGAG